MFQVNQKVARTFYSCIENKPCKQIAPQFLYKSPLQTDPNKFTFKQLPFLKPLSTTAAKRTIRGPSTLETKLISLLVFGILLQLWSKAV